VHVSCASPHSASRSFLDSSLRQIAQARQAIEASGRALMLQVDGDISAENIASVAAAGADAFVVGRAIFGQSDYRSAVAALRAAITPGAGLRAAA
jgi:ribulose-phosphate 3-epimerase